MESTYSVLFLGRVRVVETKIAFAAKLRSQPEVEIDRLGVPDVQVSVRLRWKARLHSPAMFACLDVLDNDVANEIRSASGFNRHIVVQ